VHDPLHVGGHAKGSLSALAEWGRVLPLGAMSCTGPAKCGGHAKACLSALAECCPCDLPLVAVMQKVFSALSPSGAEYCP
jgi:hypothetical protein